MKQTDLENLEELWAQYQEQIRHEADLSILDFADRHPACKEQILQLFPLMEELQKLGEEEPRDPEQIDNFRILRRIGFGGMGVVYEARDLTLSHRVALKLIECSGMDIQAIEKQQREVAIASGLNHPNIVPVYEHGSFESKLYFTMRIVDGPNLAEVIHYRRENGVELASQERECLRFSRKLEDNWLLQIAIMKQAASALAYAHGRGVIHRDIKPANIILDQNGKAWLTDFGLARKIGDDLSRSSFRLRATGTPRYMAPEQIRGESDQRSDIFGLGITFYEMAVLTGADSDLKNQIWRGGLRPPKERNPAVPDPLDKLILKAVSLDPANRHASASELLDELAVVEKQLQEERLESHPKRKSSQDQRRIEVGMVSGLIFLVLSIFGLLHSLRQLVLRPKSQYVASATDVATPAVDLISNDEPHARERPGDEAESSEPPKRSENTAVGIDPLVFENDHRTILLRPSQLNFPMRIPLLDKSVSSWSGVFAQLVGGKHQNLFGMTPNGTLALLDTRHIQKLKSNTQIELDVAVREQSTCKYMQFFLASDGSITLAESVLVGPDSMATRVIAEQLVLPENLIDCASRDGRFFYHLHQDRSGTASLYRSELNQENKLHTTLVQEDCGARQDAIGFSQTEEGNFLILQPITFNSENVVLSRSVLSKSGEFNEVVSTAKTTRSRAGSFSALTENQFQICNPNTKQFYFAFPYQETLVRMPLNLQSFPKLGRLVAQTAWIESGEKSLKTVKRLRLSISDDNQQSIATAR
ncbi:MAG: serine/threonine-protein kinase [Planctomycetota bacterium]